MLQLLMAKENYWLAKDHYIQKLLILQIGEARAPKNTHSILKILLLPSDNSILVWVQQCQTPIC